MLFHNIINTREKQLMKEKIEDQLETPYKDCWVESILKKCNKYEIDLEEVRYSKKQYPSQ